MSRDGSEVPPSSDPTMTWVRYEDWLQLKYRGSPLITICPGEGGGVVIRTRSYSEGPTASRVMATEAGALRYADAWLSKWRGQAKAEIDNKLASAQVQMAAAEASRADYPDSDPATFTKRRRR
ncbi:hypothetical protein FHR51_002584 [Xanthomonas arboricola]|nr:hypothetical protein [Xanthomonas cannabis]